jgi:hypothetical protein
VTLAAHPSAPVVSSARAGALTVLGAVALAAVSLLRPWALAFDPMAWLVWGRDSLHLGLDTSPGPSWKPLPVLFTAPLALVPGAAPALWLIVARAGGLLALAAVWALAERLAGRWAGLAAALTMALSPWWLFNTALGNSEGLLAAVAVWGVVAHLGGHRRAAVVLGTAAALLRPEVWPFLGIYGIWLWRTDPRARPVLAVCGAIVPLLWFGPDAIGAGGALGASKAARGAPSPGSAALASFPALALVKDTGDILTVPALAAALIAVALGGRTVRVLAAGAAAWVAIVAAMTQAGYAGNPRYLVAATALACALAGAGAVRLARAARRGAPLGAALLVAAVLAASLGTLRHQVDQLSDRARAQAEFNGVIAAGGGRDAVLRCGPLRTGVGARSFVAWRLDIPMRGLGARLSRPGAVLRAKSAYGPALEPAMSPARAGFRVVVTVPHWQLVEACGG